MITCIKIDNIKNRYGLLVVLFFKVYNIACCIEILLI